MPAYIVLGTQWGDEGKGKFVDVLGGGMDYIIRYQGGNNAGHTIVTEKGEFILHLLPSGIVSGKADCIIGNGVVFDPKAFLEELELLKSLGIDTERIYISNRAHVIMPYHIKFDFLHESQGGGLKIGTTKRGIGPCYTDKYNRTGITVADLINKESFYTKLQNILPLKNDIIKKIYNTDGFNLDTVYSEYCGYAEQLKSRVIDAAALLQQALKENKRLLFEGAQGTMLDVDFGTYPYVTSSNTTAGGIFTNTGIAPRAVDKVIGIAKAYTTRVGEGPFVTELHDETGSIIRERGHEYGATTKRPRRCGWLDAVALRYAVNLNGLTDIILTKLDILGGFDEIKVCTAYEVNGRATALVPATLEELEKTRPVYKSFPGWQEDISGITRFEELPANCRSYITAVEELIGCSVSIVSVGPASSATIFRKKLIE
jgi:adenylosuccinate synthase